MHVHTPFTKLEDRYHPFDGDIWEEFCKHIEATDVQVVGITDYFSVDNHFTFVEKYKALFPTCSKVFFPNIEFRCEASVNKKGEEVNIHVIFSDKVCKERIEQFLIKLSTNITSNSAKVCCKELSNHEYESAAIQYSQIKPLLIEIFGNDECYLIIAASNNAGLRADSKSPRKLVISDEIDKICSGFFGGGQNVEWFLKLDRYESDELSMPKPVLCGCDSHSFETIAKGLGKRNVQINSGGEEQILSDVTWVKAEPTFEGLKQIFYEPKFRLLIGDKCPRKPSRRIESIQFNFPNSTTIKRYNGVHHQDFCIRDLKHKIHFSPYFTCLIGGRGSGKSTIVNLLAKRLGINTAFFSHNENSLFESKSSAKPYDLTQDLQNFIVVEGTNEVEFISQGRVEELSEGDALNRMIIEERVLRPGSKLLSLQEQIKNLQLIVDGQVKFIQRYGLIREIIQQKEKEKENDEKIIASINDKEYKRITDEIKNVTDRIGQIDNSKLKYSLLLERVKAVVEVRPEATITNEYEQRVKKINMLITTIQEVSVIDEEVNVIPTSFPSTEQLHRELLSKKIDEQLNQSFFLKAQGTSIEAIEDAKTASDNIAKLSTQIHLLQEEEKTIEKAFAENKTTVEKLKELYNNIRIEVTKSLGAINKQLEINNKNVSSIRYEHSFEHSAYKKALFKEFYGLMKPGYAKPNVREDDLLWMLFQVEPDEDILTKSFIQFQEDLSKKGDKRNLYYQIIFSIFEKESHYKIYQQLVQKHLYDYISYIEIKGYYGQRELINCSFGQKCTAVIVTLLMSGVKPLIIDEPEAHLDNKLIADYLVDLIKEKKCDRQIIFATHNANFVVNADAELIHILEVPENDCFTKITFTTVENIAHREKLLRLEGGRKAFEYREKKLLGRSF